MMKILRVIQIITIREIGDTSSKTLNDHVYVNYNQ